MAQTNASKMQENNMVYNIILDFISELVSNLPVITKNILHLFCFIHFKVVGLYY